MLLRPDQPGSAIGTASVSGTGLFIMGSAAAVLWTPFRKPLLVADVALFVIGCAVFLAAYVRALDRSRTSEIGLGDLFFLGGGTAPVAIRRLLLRSLLAEVVVALLAAFARPYSELAAGILVPVYGFGLATLWSARHGTFPPRSVSSA